jgi:hypothetical protein
VDDAVNNLTVLDAVYFRIWPQKLLSPDMVPAPLRKP